MIPDNGNLDERKKTTFCKFLLLIMFSCHLSREGEAINLKTTQPNLKKRVLLENTIKCKLIYETMGKVAKISKGRDQQFGGVLNILCCVFHRLLPARASEQGNVIGSVRIYIYIYIYICVYKKNCN